MKIFHNDKLSRTKPSFAKFAKVSANKVVSTFYFHRQKLEQYKSAFEVEQNTPVQQMNQMREDNEKLNKIKLTEFQNNHSDHSNDTESNNNNNNDDDDDDDNDNDNDNNNNYNRFESSEAQGIGSAYVSSNNPYNLHQQQLRSLNVNDDKGEEVNLLQTEPRQSNNNNNNENNGNDSDGDNGNDSDTNYSNDTKSDSNDSNRARFSAGNLLNLLFLQNLITSSEFTGEREDTENQEQQMVPNNFNPFL